jgi:hypothetical protein
MAIRTAVPGSQDIVVCYNSLGGVRGQPPVIANLLRPCTDVFTPTIPGKSITQLWKSVYSGPFTTPVSESLEVHHYHPIDEECINLATAALEFGEVWKVSELLTHLRGCRDKMSLFRDSARLTHPLKLVTPSVTGGLPQITDNGTADLREVLETQRFLDHGTISRVERLFSSWVFRLNPSTSLVMERPRRELKASAVEFSMPSSLPLRGEMLLDPRAFRSTEEAPDATFPSPDELPATDGGIQRGLSLLEIFRQSIGIGPVRSEREADEEGVGAEGSAEPAQLDVREEESSVNNLFKSQSCGDFRSLSELPDRGHLETILRKSSI